MPFNHKTVMEQKHEFVLLAKQGTASFSELCRRFGITRRTGYKLLSRYNENGQAGLCGHSKKPHTSPFRTGADTEREILKMRAENPEWGGKKIAQLLAGVPGQAVPAVSTVNAILKRNGMVKKEKSEASGAWTRFEHEAPNDLWQMDFKGHFAMQDKKRCHPLTILDDHSRFNIGLFACGNEQHGTVQQLLVQVFRCYGLPKAILADNGSPWAGSRYNSQGDMGITALEKWLYQLNIKVLHGRPYHPQTQGKEERFHRTLKAELLQYEEFRDTVHAQQRFDWWRHKYNCIRPHEAIGLKAPTSRYCISTRPYKEHIVQPEYDATAAVKKVHDGGFIYFMSDRFRVGKAFVGDNVAVKPTLNEKEYEVYYYNQMISRITLQ